jgi:hypothetical protein
VLDRPSIMNVMPDAARRSPADWRWLVPWPRYSPIPPPLIRRRTIENCATLSQTWLESGAGAPPYEEAHGAAGQQHWLTSKTAPDYFERGDVNVGVQLGDKSNGLSDVDLDCREALVIGPLLLPETNALFGRKSKPRSHPHIKPISLITRLSGAVTKPGDLVVDPAAGGFTVMHVVAEMGRKFIGCDIAHHKEDQTAA